MPNPRMREGVGEGWKPSNAPTLSGACGHHHPNDPEVVCFQDYGHDGEHQALMVVRWSA